MRIEIVVDPVNLPGHSLEARCACSCHATNGTTDAPLYDEDPLSWSEDLIVSSSRRRPRRGREHGARRRNECPNEMAADLDIDAEMGSDKAPIPLSVFSRLRCNQHTPACRTWMPRSFLTVACPAPHVKLASFWSSTNRVG